MANGMVKNSKWRKIVWSVSKENWFYEKTARQRSGNFSDSNSSCLKKVFSVKFPQFHGMLNESERYRVKANGLINFQVFTKKNQHNFI